MKKNNEIREEDLEGELDNYSEKNVCTLSFINH